MTEGIVVRVITSRGTTFVAGLANLTDRSALLVTDEKIRFRESLIVEMFGRAFEAIVAITLERPIQGVVVAFEAPPDMQRDLLARSRTLPVFGQGASAWRADPSTTPPPADPTPNDLHPFDEVTMRNDMYDLDRSTDLSRRTSAVFQRPSILDRDSGMMTQRLLPVSSTPGTDPGPDVLATDGGEAGPSTDPVPVIDVPELDENGITIRFRSLAQYAAHFETNLSQGSLLVRARGLPMGAVRTFRLRIPGVAVEYAIEGRVAFEGQQAIALVVQDFAKHASSLASLAAPIRAK